MFYLLATESMLWYLLTQATIFLTIFLPWPDHLHFQQNNMQVQCSWSSLPMFTLNCCPDVSFSLLFVMFQGDRVLRRRSPGLEVSNLKIWVINLSVSISLNITPINIWGKVFKNGLNKFCGRQPLKNLLSPLVNTLSHVSLKHQKLTPKLLGCLRRY